MALDEVSQNFDFDTSSNFSVMVFETIVTLSQKRCTDFNTIWLVGKCFSGILQQIKPKTIVYGSHVFFSSSKRKVIIFVPKNGSQIL